MEINKAIKIMMVAAGEQQKELAEAVGMRPANLCNKLNGNRKFSIEEMRRIMKHYNITPDELFSIFME